jgi:hypothetical protein
MDCLDMEFSLYYFGRLWGVVGGMYADSRDHITSSTSGDKDFTDLQIKTMRDYGSGVMLLECDSEYEFVQDPREFVGDVSGLGTNALNNCASTPEGPFQPKPTDANFGGIKCDSAYSHASNNGCVNKHGSDGDGYLYVDCGTHLSMPPRPAE